jgi:hypothetical protein
MIGGEPDIVPPGNAVLGEHHGGVVAEQRRQAGDETWQRVGLQRRNHDILRPQRRRIVGCADFRREFSVAHAKRQAFRLYRLQMRPPHHAGHLMPGQRQPHRKMTADGA